MQSGLNTVVTPIMKPGREGQGAKKGRNAKILKAQSQIISTRSTDGQSQHSRTLQLVTQAQETEGKTETQEGGRLGKDRKPKGDKKRSWISNPTY